MIEASRPLEVLRLDELLVRLGHFPSRARARDAVLRGTVSVGGAVVAKPSRATPSDSPIEVCDPASAYVSRAALKLLKGIDTFGFDPSGRLALDLGASTGGFTQVLLERGAREVIAVDVGHRQMAAAIAADARVRLLEGVNARDLDLDLIGGEQPSFLTCDVSFISLRLALPPALDLALPGTQAVILVKPQFEVGREGVGKGGLVDEMAGLEAAEAIRAWMADRHDWRVIDMVPSPLEGGDGNREYLLGAVKQS